MKIGNKDFVFKFEYKKPKLIWRFILGLLSFLIISFIIIFSYLYIKVNKAIKVFSAAAEISKEELTSSINSSLQIFQNSYQNLDQLKKESNFLILGTDKLPGRDTAAELTDGILLLKLDSNQNQLTTISLPRDLYNDAYQTRINALYHYGKDHYPENPEQFTEEVLEKMLNLEIDHTIVLKIKDLEELINILDGIEINVPIAFTDPLFPRSGIDVTVERDPEILYEEISFETGLQKMTGETALKYMRSRHSEDEEGTDNARSQRQGLVLEALVSEIKNIRDIETLGKLYRFYLDNFKKYLSLEELIHTFTPIYESLISSNNFQMDIVRKELSIYPEDPEGAIYNPPTWQTNGEWLYKIRSQEKFLEELNNL